MALIKCSACQADISSKAASCPKCGQPNPKANHISGGRAAGMILFSALAIWWFAAGGMQGAADTQMRAIESQVAEDAVKQYEIAKRQGDPIQVCVHAGMVSAAFLQAKDEASYRTWKGVQSSACERAGVPM